MTDIDVPERQQNPAVIFKREVESRQHEFAAILPTHIPAERFVRVILTAVNKNPKLLYANRASLFASATMAAADGLLCDGREAALVIYSTKKKDQDGNDRWIDAVQYMPMVAGILKKCRNSGELSSIVARAVYAGDHFRNWIDDDGEHIEYEAGESQDRDIVRCAFAMAKLKDGSIEVEVLKPADIEKIRSISKSKDKGPWVEWWEEMAKKSAIRRLSKRLPLNTDIDDLIRRDDAMYDLEGTKVAPIAQVQTLDGKLDRLAVLPSSPQAGEQIDADTGEVITNSAAAGSLPNPTAAPEAGPVPPGPATSTHADIHPAASGQGTSSDPPSEGVPAGPKNNAEYRVFAESWISESTDDAEVETRWKGERNMRSKVSISQEVFEYLERLKNRKIADIRDADRS